MIKFFDKHRIWPQAVIISGTMAAASFPRSPLTSVALTLVTGWLIIMGFRAYRKEDITGKYIYRVLFFYILATFLWVASVIAYPLICR